MPARTRPASTSATRSAATASATASCAGPPALRGVRIHPPGTGIMHTLNLEQLAVLVRELDLGGERWAAPDMMIGTDSHTPMINGIGVLGWGVGGLEAQTVMFGMPTMLRIPDVIGVELTGALPPGALATDLALTVTQRLRQIGVSGEFVEFFGPGVATLSAGSRAVVANMAPEYGATTGYFRPTSARWTICARPAEARTHWTWRAPTCGATASGSTPGPPALHAHHHHRAGRHRQPRGRPAPAARPTAAGGRAGRAGREAARARPARRTACRPIPWPSPRSPAAPTPRTRRC